MGVNRDTHAPTVRAGIDYDVDFVPSLSGIDVMAPGRLAVIDIEGNTWEHNFIALNPSAMAAEAYTTFPHRVNLQIKRIVGDGAGNVGTGAGQTNLVISTNQIYGLH